MMTTNIQEWQTIISKKILADTKPLRLAEQDGDAIVSAFDCSGLDTTKDQTCSVTIVQTTPVTSLHSILGES